MKIKTSFLAIALMASLASCDDDSSNNDNNGVCNLGDSQTGTTVCGFNDEGFLIQNCVGGQWQDTTECTGTDVCTNGETQNGPTVCGENNEGFLVQECTEGQWVDTTECNTELECTNGQTQTGTTVCGLNDEGFLIQECSNGQWVDSSECTGDDICTNGDTQNGTTVCGLNDEGFFIEECINGFWQDTTECAGDDVCTNGHVQTGTTVCGLNDEGFYMQECVGGQWVDTECTGADICLNGTTQVGLTPCGYNNTGRLEQDCISGQWVNGTDCIDEIFIVINEIKTGTDGWIELYNDGLVEKDISGYIISIEGTNSAIPASTVLAPGEYYIFSGTINEGSNIHLSEPPGGKTVNHVYHPTVTPIYGRYPNGSGGFQELFIPTQAAENTDLQPLTINWCDVQFPQDFTANAGDMTTIYGQVYIPGITGDQGTASIPEPQMRARLCWSDGTTDTCVDADFNSSHSGNNNDEYMADVAFANPDTYLYWYEFSGDMANTWTVCANIYTATINSAPASCDVSGYRLHQENSTYNYTFAAGTIIPAGKTLILVRGATTGTYDQATFETVFGLILPAGTVYINSAGSGLAMNGAETYELFDASNVSVDGPTVAMSGLTSYQRNATNAPAGDAASWTSGTWSTTITPGTFNGTAANTGKPIISEFSENSVYQWEYVEIYCDK